MKLLAIRLSPRAGKSLVIRRRPESSVFNQLDTGLRRCDELFEVPSYLVRYKQAAVGIVWALVRPLITTMVFTPVFSKLAIDWKPQATQVVSGKDTQGKNFSAAELFA